MLKDDALAYMNAQESAGVTFPYFFKVFQNMGMKHFSPEAVIKELCTLKSSPPRDMTRYLMELWSLNTLLHSKVPEQLRFGKITDSYRADVLSMMASYYPHLHSIVKDKDSALYVAYATELQNFEANGWDLDGMVNNYHPYCDLTTIVLTHTSAEEVAEVFKSRNNGRRTGHTNAVSGGYDNQGKSPRSKGGKKTQDWVDAASMAVHTGGNRRDRRDNRSDGRSQGRQQRDGYQGSKPDRKFGEPQGQYPNKNEHSTFTRRAPTNAANNAVTGGQGRTGASTKCNNCTRVGHKWRECKKYGGATPTNRQCGTCGGGHAASCVDQNKKSTSDRPKARRT
jgi:hypothetical protein